MKKLTLAAIMVLLCTLSSAAQDFNKAGRTTFQFLKIGMGARAAALGEAGIANMQDVNAVFWNPAAVTGIKGVEAGFNYTRWFADLNVMAGAVGFRAGGLGVFALHYTTLDYGTLQEALVTSPTGGVDTRTGNSFGGNDLALGCAFARAFTDKLSIGVNAKYLREELHIYTSSLWGFDVGTYYNTGWRGIRLAMSAQNFSKQARWLDTGGAEQQKYELPLLFRVGWSIDLLGGEELFLGGSPERYRLALNMDAVHSNDYAERLHVGTEYVLYNLIALRGGYRINYDEGKWSFGFGLSRHISNVKMRLDYAYVDYDFLDSPHRLTALFAF
ncbi:MAG: hypothetical protein DKINENOH_04742 [bacterium]|nr:hypothetical protein [bacterium]